VFDSTVHVVEPRGNENTAHLQFDESMDEQFIATVGGMKQLKAGQHVKVGFPENAIHLFDTSSGSAIRNRTLDEIETVESVV
jgi:multiple sugar transport system ATP-binding protein